MLLQQILLPRATQLNHMIKPVLVGAAIALTLICVFLFAGNITTQPEWGNYWKLKPLIIVPLAGAMGGLFFHFMNNLLWLQVSWKKILAIIIGCVGYVFTIWIGTVLGLNGTLWN